MGEYFYQPADVVVPRNSKITIVNEGSLVHSWVVKGAGVGTAGLPPGQSIIVFLAAVPPGTYTIYCDQPGHTQLGQAGILTITP